ncbi:MAG: mercury methylation ferredoxin HgcB [Planctomycetota bacterium]
MKLRYLRDVVTLNLDEGQCTGCGMCLEVCPRGVIAMTEGKARIVDRDACMECGACARNCPAEAIRVRSGVGCAYAVINAALKRKSACSAAEEESGAEACGDSDSSAGGLCCG